tara:strand:+ start:472 stop:717 length:246 start_codon:yes stop_codon:yes gene_type:complete
MNNSNKLKDYIFNECINMVKKDEIKKEIKNILRPLIDLILKEIYPYIYLSVIFVFLNFLLILGVFLLLLRYNKYIKNIIKK